MHNRRNDNMGNMHKANKRTIVIIFVVVVYMYNWPMICANGISNAYCITAVFNFL